MRRVVGGAPWDSTADAEPRRLCRAQPQTAADVSAESGFFFQAEDGIRDLTVTGVQTVLFRSFPHSSKSIFRDRRTTSCVSSTDYFFGCAERSLATTCELNRRLKVMAWNPTALPRFRRFQSKTWIFGAYRWIRRLRPFSVPTVRFSFATSRFALNTGSRCFV